MATQHTRSFPLRLWSGFWNFIGVLRRGFFNFIFLFVLIALVAAMVSGRQHPLPAQAPLYIAPMGHLVDQFSYRDPAALLMGGQDHRATETRVADLVRAIDAAGSDSRISALVLHLDYLNDSGTSKIAEVAEAIMRFKTSKKPVIAYADNYSQQQYFLAAHADEVYLNDMGSVMLTGLGIYRNYYKTVIDKLSVNFHVFRVGNFKDFVEPYTRTDMSAASRQHNSEWMQELWGLYTNRVELQRHLASGSLNTLIDDMHNQLTLTHGDPAQLALKNKLVDKIGSRVARMDELIKRFGEDKTDKGVYQHVELGRYLDELDSHDNPTEPGNIGLIVAQGTISDGDQPAGSIGGDSLSRLLRQAKQDDDIKALVVRVDSGGGSAFASELIRQELQAVRDAGKPVFISMGSVAASGGYWMAMAADQVWATPSTITGSIGVFGLFPTFEDSLEKIGVNTDGIATNELAGAMRLDRPLSPMVEKVVQQGVESIYHRFLTLVGKARNHTPEEINEIAQGRVWTGGRAQALGLVDNLGYLTDVVKACADFAKIDHYKIKLIEKELTPQERLMRTLLAETQTWQGARSGATQQMLNTLAKLPWAELEPLIQTSQGIRPITIMAQCLDCVAP